MGEGALYTAGATWAVDLAPARRQGLALGLFGLAVWGGLSLGPLVGRAAALGGRLQRRLGADGGAPVGRGP